MGRSAGGVGILLPVVDRSPEGMLGGPGERQGRRRNFEGVAARGFYVHRKMDEPELFRDERGGNDAGSAGEGFGLDPALVGADGKGSGASRLNKIGVGSGRGE